MYRNLEAEMARKGLSKREVAEGIGMNRYPTFIEKMNGNYKFKLDEAVAIRDNFFPDLTLDYLFENTKETEEVK
jgi:hypothetical protein